MIIKKKWKIVNPFSIFFVKLGGFLLKSETMFPVNTRLWQKE